MGTGREQSSDRGKRRGGLWHTDKRRGERRRRHTIGDDQLEHGQRQQNRYSYNSRHRQLPELNQTVSTDFTAERVHEHYTTATLLTSLKKMSLVKVHRVPKKGDTTLMAVTPLISADFQNFFTARFSRKFSAKHLLTIAPYLTCVATLPCGMSEKRWGLPVANQSAVARRIKCRRPPSCW